MDFLRYQYQKTYEFQKKHFKLILPLTTLIFVIAIVIFSLYLSMNPGTATRLLLLSGDNINNSINLYGLLPTLIKNLFTSLLAIVAGIVPFLFLPLGIVIYNGSLIGILLGSTSISSVTPALLVAYILPHGFVMIPAMLLATSYGIYLCKCMLLHILHKKQIASFPQLFIELLRGYIFVVVPLILVATLLNVFVTPLIMMLL